MDYSVDTRGLFRFVHRLKPTANKLFLFHDGSAAATRYEEGLLSADAYGGLSSGSVEKVSVHPMFTECSLNVH